LLAKDNDAVRAKRLAIGRSGILPDYLQGMIRSQSISPFRLDILKKQGAIGLPKRSLGELKTVDQPLDLLARNQIG
jgi:hypothetical protein